MFSLQNRQSFIQSLKGDAIAGAPIKEKLPSKKRDANVPSFLKNIKTNSKETPIHDTSAKTEDQKRREIVKKTKRKKDDYIVFDV